MITKEEYIKAKKIIECYEQEQLNIPVVSGSACDEPTQIWTIRLVNNGLKYLTSYKARGMRWGHYKNAITFKSKYECKQLFNQLKDVALCEIYQAF